MPRPFLATLRWLDRWVDETRGFFPPHDANRLIHQEQAPVSLHPRGGVRELFALRQAIAQAHVDVAANLITARPGSSGAKVAAILVWPNTEWSQVCVFFDLEYFRSFEQRDNEYQRWRPLPKFRSLARKLELRVPARLRLRMRERGYREWDFDPSNDPPARYQGEIWMLGD